MNDNPHNQSPGAAPRRRRRRIRDRYGRTVKVDKKTGEPIHARTDNLEFTLYIKYVTGQQRSDRALDWMKRWAAAHPKERREDIETWLESEKDLPRSALKSIAESSPPSMSRKYRAKPNTAAYNAEKRRINAAARVPIKSEKHCLALSNTF